MALTFYSYQNDDLMLSCKYPRIINEIQYSIQDLEMRIIRNE
jgi:hypothetical protein